jgi:hypothetical protein
MILSCTREGCIQAAVYQAGLRAWCQGMPKNPENSCECLFTVFSCVIHSQELIERMYMEEAVWIAFSRRFKIVKGVPPSWSTSEGFLQEIESGKRTYSDDPRAH